MLQFLRQTLASLLGTLLALLLAAGVSAGALAVVLAAIAAQQSSSDPKVRDKTILVFDLSVQIRDTAPLPTFADSLAGNEPETLALRQVLDAIEKATWDERIVGILLDGRTDGELAGYATLREIRTALEKFRETGKTIVAYDINLSEPEYYLASVADRILVNPIGAVEFNGFRSEQLFLAGALEKFGIGVQVVRVGAYKSAVEPFTRENLSPENRQQTAALLADLWQTFLEAVAASRDLDIAGLQTLADTQGLLLPAAAETAQLVDGQAYFDEVVAELRELTGEEPDEEDDSSDSERRFRQIDLETYSDVPVENADQRDSDHKIAVLYAEGAIVSGEGTTGQVGSDSFVQQLRRLRRDRDVKAIVLRINSPGGSATASEIILRELQLTSAEKPAIVSMGDVAASGGYWLATGASYIFAEPTTITGSIGVFGLLLNLEGLANNNGVTWDAVKTAELAELDTASRPKTAAELATIQRFVDRIYELFLTKVAEARSLSRQQVAEIAQGRVWSGTDAKSAGLVDELGGLSAAIAYAAEAAELGDDWEVEDYEDEPTWEERLLRSLPLADLTRTQPPRDPLQEQAERLRRELDFVRHLSDPRGVYTYLPFTFRIE